MRQGQRVLPEPAKRLSNNIDVHGLVKHYRIHRKVAGCMGSLCSFLHRRYQSRFGTVRHGAAVGSANFYRWDGGTCCIRTVVVAPSARDQGIAIAYSSTSTKARCSAVVTPLQLSNALTAVMLGLVEKDVIPILFAEGEYNDRLEVIADFPYDRQPVVQQVYR